MRDYQKMVRDILNEDDRPTKVKDRAKNRTQDVKFDQAAGGEVSTSRSTSDTSRDTGDRSSSGKVPPGKRAHGSSARAQMPRSAAQSMQHFADATVDVEDDEVYDPYADGAELTQTPVGTPEPRNPDNLPDNVRTNVTTKDDGQVPSRINLTWYPVRTLPGFSSPQIRGAFKPLFRDELGIELADAQVATDMAGSGTHSTRIFAGALLKHGTIINEWDSLEAFGIPKEVYNVGRAAVIDYEGQRYFIMTEKHGSGEEYNFIYWGPDAGGDSDNKRLKRT